MNKDDYLKGISLPGEEWRELYDYDGYSFSSLGRVASFKRKTPVLLSPYIADSRGKKYAVSHFGKKHRRKSIHRLIALAFIPNPNNLPEVDHINNCGTDNRACNLRWCTRKENMNNPLTKQNKEIYYPRAEILRSTTGADVHLFKNENKDKAKRVAQCKDGEVVRVFESLGEADRNGFLKTSVSAACNGRLKTYRGFEWHFLP